MKTEFSYLKEEFLRRYANQHPTSAFSWGWREYAGILPDYRLNSIKSYTTFLKIFLKKLSKIDESSFSDIDLMNIMVMKLQIESELFIYTTLKVYENDVFFYFQIGFIFDYLLKDYAPPEQRIRELVTYFEQLPDYFSVAIKNLRHDKVSKEVAVEAIKIGESLLEFIKNIDQEVMGFLQDDEKLSEASLKLLQSAKKSAYIVFKEFTDYIKSNLDNFTGDYRLGKENFEGMLRTSEGINITIETILEIGTSDLKQNLSTLKKVAEKIDNTKTVGEVSEQIKKFHPTTESLIPDIQEMLKETRDFLITSKFVSVPTDEFPEVIYTPKPYRNWAFAAMDCPEALERKAKRSYYYITPPDESWSKEDQIDWLKTFNYKGLLDISVHEAFPGHFLHSLHNNRSKAIMSKLFWNYHFGEGYALYVEEALWEHGFHKDDLEYRFAQLLETLTRNVRLINAIKLHTEKNYTIEDGTELFMKNAFLGHKPAESEAIRGIYDPGYLNYIIGKLLINKLKSDYKKEKGADYSPLEFHDKLLSWGAPPVPFLRKFMLGKTNIHAEIL